MKKPSRLCNYNDVSLLLQSHSSTKLTLRCWVSLWKHFCPTQRQHKQKHWAKKGTRQALETPARPSTQPDPAQLCVQQGLAPGNRAALSAGQSPFLGWLNITVCMRTVGKVLQSLCWLPPQLPQKSQLQPQEKGAGSQSPKWLKAEKSCEVQQNAASSLFILLMHHFLLITFSIGKKTWQAAISFRPNHSNESL